MTTLRTPRMAPPAAFVAVEETIDLSTGYGTKAVGMEREEGYGGFSLNAWLSDARGATSSSSRANSIHTRRDDAAAGRGAGRARARRGAAALRGLQGAVELAVAELLRREPIRKDSFSVDPGLFGFDVTFIRDQYTREKSDHPFQLERGIIRAWTESGCLRAS